MSTSGINGRKRVVIDSVRPQLDGGRFPIKRALGETIAVEAHVFADSHDHLRAELLHRPHGKPTWNVEEMVHQGRDVWTASFQATPLGTCRYTIRAWIDHFSTWQATLKKRCEADQDVTVDLRIGAKIVRAAVKRAAPVDARKLTKWATLLSSARDGATAVEVACSEELAAVIRKYPDRSLATTYEKELLVTVDRREAVFSTWYELFPRSLGKGVAHGTFRDCEDLLPRIARMGFDILYLPPIHPIGRTGRKGKNNAAECAPADPGCPWAIGADERGHKSIHPQLGSPAGFRRLVRKAKQHGLEVALDLAFQCSPDHPYVRAHPEWFRRRPDGTVQCAENPPKRYEDILPFDFETKQWKSLWEELKSVVLFWIEQGIRIFRVDNPHTKPFAFWEWLIAEIRRDHPDIILLAEAFTRRKVMQRLAKVGFSQSYTYFTWRNTKGELEQYIQELAHTELSEYLRPNFWPNTPDILPAHLQDAGRAAFIIRLVLAATLCPSYGIYGPSYELCVDTAIEGTEEYLDSEKYEIKRWNWNRKGNIRAVIARVNRARRRHISLQNLRNIQIHSIDNDNMLCYSKASEDKSDITVMVVSLDPRHVQTGKVKLSLDALGIDPHEPYRMEDVLTGETHLWRGRTNRIRLDPAVMPAQILCLRRGRSGRKKERARQVIS